MEQINTALGFYSIAVCLLLLIGILSTEDRHDRLTRTIIGMLIFNILAIACDLGAWKLVGRLDSGVIPLLLHVGVYLCAYMLATLFDSYIAAYITLRTGKSLRTAHMVPVACAVFSALLVIFAANGLYFSYDPAGAFVFGPLKLLIYLFPLLTLLGNVVRIWYFRKELGRPSIASLTAFALIPLLGVAVQTCMQKLQAAFTTTTMALLVIYITIHISSSRRLKEQGQELTDSRIAIMLSQIQPHFLYNALAAISALCDLDADKAKQATVAFAHYLRENLDSLKNRDPVPFEKELHHVENYMFLEKLRFGDDLVVLMNITAKDFLLPALTLQPLVENAVHYGIGQREDGGMVVVSTRDCGDHIEISVEDNGVGFDPSEVQYDGRSHIGISNVQSRLKAMCGGSLEVSSVKGKGTLSVIRLPKH